MSEINIEQLSLEQRVGLLYKLAKMSYNPPNVAFAVEFISYLSTPSANSNSQDIDLIKRGYIDRFNGKVIKTNLSGNTFDSCLYNRDNGAGAAERITQAYIATLKL